MSHSKHARQISTQILEEACDWFIDLNEGELDADACERLNQWLRRSPEHVQAYLEIASMWQDASVLGGAQGLEVAALVDQARSEGNVVLLHPGPSALTARATADTQSSSQRPTTRTWQIGVRLRWLLATAACVLAAVGIALLRRGDIYATGVGELRTVALADGSTVELDTRSKVRVRFSRSERMVDLVDGQALFVVQKDAARPFVVVTNGARVRAVGTQFDVYRKPVGTTITIVEGKVAVTEIGLPTHAAGAAPILLSAGEQLTLTPGAAPQAAPADLEVATAWTRRKLIFMEAPLSKVVAEMNRYNTRQITIDDPSIYEYHVRGSFEASDPERLLRFLRERFDVDVREQGNEIRVSRK